MSIKYSFQKLQAKKTLIMGDVQTGKTQLTLTLIEETLAAGLSHEITVLDMAPSTTQINGIRVGGRLNEYSNKLKNLRYLTPLKVETPRLSAKSADELLHLVNLNEQNIRPLLRKYIDDPTSILFVNDVSIYLQSGQDELVLSAMDLAETFIANGYYGWKLDGDYETEVSKIEKNLMDKLAKKVDIIIKL